MQRSTTLFERRAVGQMPSTGSSLSVDCVLSTSAQTPQAHQYSAAKLGQLVFSPTYDTASTSSYSPSSIFVSPISTSSSAQTPITPFALASPASCGENDAHGSSFGALQDAYLAQRNAQNLSSANRMQRMSLSTPLHANGPFQEQHLAAPKHNDYRRASVATFQPTPARPTPFPVRPAYQPTSVSEPLMLHQPAMTSTASTNMVAPQHPQAHQQFHPVSGVDHGVDRLYAQVFGQNQHDSLPPANPDLFPPVPAHTTLVVTPDFQHQSARQQGQQDPANYNFSGVLLQPDDFHMLGPDPLACNVEQHSYQQGLHQAGIPPQPSGWQSAFSFSGPASTSALPLVASAAPNPSWTFSSFHGFEPIVTPSLEYTSSPFERTVSAPLAHEDLYYSHNGNLTGNRRRGSSIDSAALAPGDPMAFLSPHSTQTQAATPYLSLTPSRPDPGPRRATFGPSSLSPSTGYSPYRIPASTSPPRSSSINNVLPPPTTPLRRTSGKAVSRRSSAASSTPLFINFTSRDANKLLTGVAPSGSSKRKREEEEMAKLGKSNKDETMSS